MIFVSATPDQGDCAETAGAVTCSLGDLPSGATAEVVIVVTTSSPGTLTNSASGASDMVDLSAGNNDASEDTTVNPVPVPEADLSIAKAGSPSPVDAGALLTYTMVVTNTGPDAATTVTVTNSLPDGVTYGGALGDGWICGQIGGTVTCTRPSLPVGVAPAIVLTVTAPSNGGTITNSVLVSSATHGGNSGNNAASEATTITPSPVEGADLSIVMLDGPDPVKVSITLTYTLIVTNAGPDAAAAITVTDQLPSRATYGGASGDAWSCSHLAGLVSCTRPSMGVGVAPTIILTVTAPASSRTLTNTVTVSGNDFDPAKANNTTTAVTQVKFPYRSYLPLIRR